MLTSWFFMLTRQLNRNQPRQTYYPMQRRHIILADRQDITRLGLRTLVKASTAINDGMEITRAATMDDVISTLKEKPLSVVVIDVTNILTSAEELLNLSECFKEAMWVLFSNELPENIVRSVAANSRFSLLLKNDSAHEIAAAVVNASDGARYVCQRMAHVLLAPHEGKSLLEQARLTATEIEVLRLIAFGKSVKEVANERGSSVHTIITHKKNIFRKINVSTIYEATKYALRAGLIDYSELTR